MPVFMVFDGFLSKMLLFWKRKSRLFKRFFHPFYENAFFLCICEEIYICLLRKLLNFNKKTQFSFEKLSHVLLFVTKFAQIH